MTPARGVLPPLNVWSIGLAIGGVMVAAGIVLHPSLIIGGGLVAVVALVKWLLEERGESH